jgi:hypothetical protein
MYRLVSFATLGRIRLPIKDEFTDLQISRQRKYQLRMQRAKRCTECGEPAAQGSRCLKHLVKARERQRNKRGLKSGYYRTLSFHSSNCHVTRNTEAPASADSGRRVQNSRPIMTDLFFVHLGIPPGHFLFNPLLYMILGVSVFSVRPRRG